MTPEYLKNELDKIYNTPNGVLEEKANQAKRYFETIVREYFEDPTAYLLNWMDKK